MPDPALSREKSTVHVLAKGGLIRRAVDREGAVCCGGRWFGDSSQRGCVCGDEPLLSFADSLAARLICRVWRGLQELVLPQWRYWQSYAIHNGCERWVTAVRWIVQCFGGWLEGIIEWGSRGRADNRLLHHRPRFRLHAWFLT